MPTKNVHSKPYTPIHSPRGHERLVADILGQGRTFSEHSTARMHIAAYLCKQNLFSASSPVHKAYNKQNGHELPGVVCTIDKISAKGHDAATEILRVLISTRENFEN